MRSNLRDQVTKYISGQYGVDPEFPWEGDDTSAVFRHRENKKWFALIMEVRRELLGLSGKAPVACMNLKIDDMFLRDMIVREDGILPAYHMNKQHWVTVLLDAPSNGTSSRTPPYQLLGHAPKAEKAFLNISLPSFDDDFTFHG